METILWVHLLAIKVKAALDLGEGRDSEKEELVKNSSTFIQTSLKLHCTSSSLHNICTLDLTLLGEMDNNLHMDNDYRE